MASSSKSEEPGKKRQLMVTVDPKLMPAPHINAYLRLAIYIYYIFTSGCIYWGWNGLQQILYKAGAFEDACKPETSTQILIGATYYVDCPDRAAGINNLYTIAYSTHFICSFIGGWLLDQLGPRICFMVGHAFSAVAWLLIFCFPREGNVLRVAFVFIGLFCEACYIPLLSVSLYFPNANSTIMAVMGSCRSLSFLVPSLLAMVYRIEGIDRGMLGVVGGVYLLFGNVLCFFSGAFVIPKVLPIPPSEAGAVEGSKKSASGVALDKTSQAIESAEKEGLLVRMVDGVKKAFSSKLLPEFIILTCCACLFMPSIELVNKAQYNLLVASGEGGDATPVFTVFNILTFVPAPFLGALMDRLGPAVIMHFLHVCAGLFYLCASFDVYFMKIAACSWYLLAGSLCISTTYCYVNKRFPKQYFGTLVSIIFAFAGATTLLNIPIYNYGLTLKSDIPQQQFRPIAYLFMGYMSVAAVLSAYLTYISLWRHKRQELPERSSDT